MGKSIPLFIPGDIVHSKCKTWWFRVKRIEGKCYIVTNIHKKGGDSAYQIYLFQDRVAPVLSEESKITRVLNKYLDEV